MIELLEKLAAQLGTTSIYIVDKYTRFYFVDGLSTLLAGLVIIFLSFRWKPIDDDDEIMWGLKLSVKWGVFGLGLIVVNCALPVLLNPEAKAIHQLILDLRGK